MFGVFTAEREYQLNLISENIKKLNVIVRGFPSPRDFIIIKLFSELEAFIIGVVICDELD